MMSAFDKEIGGAEPIASQVQLWETPEGWKPKPSVPAADSETLVATTPATSYFARTRAFCSSLLDKYLPPHRRYLGLRRKFFLLGIFAILLCLLALAIGLGAGLSQKGEEQFLPLPSNREAFIGELTYYGPGLGACGITSTENDDIVSVSHFLYDHEQVGGDPNQNPLCGRTIRAQRFSEEAGEMRSVDLRIVDRCTGCQPTDLDVSPAAFRKLANMDLGRVDVTWAWLT